ncbi:MAG: hypothetical protein ABGY10_12545 [bacterium]|nr:hypothetical protein [Gemmatimonadota bacterium]HIL90888.1 hypothetical protein [Gemmatimonadota bacterium]
MKILHQVLSPVLICVVLAACSASDSPTDPGGTPADARTIKANPSFANDITEIFMRRGCAGSNCHGNGAGGLTISTSGSANHERLVNVASPMSGEVYVIPNDAQNSYLVKKLENRQGSGNGSRMPVGGSALDNVDLTNIKNWINAGAQNN